MKNMLFIINPRSGREQIRRHLVDILDIFVKADYQVEVYLTQSTGDAKRAVMEKCHSRDLLVCSGGDGTLNEVISGMMCLEQKVPLGYIPAGSTNDFAASLRIPKTMTEAAKAIVEGTLYPLDVGRFCDDRYFMYVAGFGAFTEVSYLTSQEKKNILGHQAYLLEGVKSLASIKPYTMKIISGDEVLEGDFLFGIVTNSISVGGFKGLVSQNVALNDGLFEVLLIRMPKTALDLSNALATLVDRNEKEQKSELVYKFKTDKLRMISKEPIDWVLDGEFGGRRGEVYIENIPGAASIKRIQLPANLKN